MSTSPRRTKVSANPTPQSVADVERALSEINAHRATLAKGQTALDEHVALLVERNRRHAEPIQAEIERLAKGVQAFCEANRSRLTKGKSKSIRFENGLVSWRTSKASVVIDDDEDNIIAIIKRMKLNQFHRRAHRSGVGGSKKTATRAVRMTFRSRAGATANRASSRLLSKPRKTLLWTPEKRRAPSGDMPMTVEGATSQRGHQGKRRNCQLCPGFCPNFSTPSPPSRFIITTREARHFPSRI